MCGGASDRTGRTAGRRWPPPELRRRGRQDVRVALADGDDGGVQSDFDGRRRRIHGAMPPAGSRPAAAVGDRRGETASAKGRPHRRRRRGRWRGSPAPAGRRARAACRRSRSAARWASTKGEAARSRSARSSSSWSGWRPSAITRAAAGEREMPIQQWIGSGARRSQSRAKRDAAARHGLPAARSAPRASATMSLTPSRRCRLASMTAGPVKSVAAAHQAHHLARAVALRRLRRSG